MKHRRWAPMTDRLPVPMSWAIVAATQDTFDSRFGCLIPTPTPLNWGAVFEGAAGPTQAYQEASQQLSDLTQTALAPPTLTHGVRCSKAARTMASPTGVRVFEGAAPVDLKRRARHRGIHPGRQGNGFRGRARQHRSIYSRAAGTRQISSIRDPLHRQRLRPSLPPLLPSRPAHPRKPPEPLPLPHMQPRPAVPAPPSKPKLPPMPRSKPGPRNSRRWRSPMASTVKPRRVAAGPNRKALRLGRFKMLFMAQVARTPRRGAMFTAAIRSQTFKPRFMAIPLPGCRRAIPAPPCRTTLRNRAMLRRPAGPQTFIPGGQVTNWEYAGSPGRSRPHHRPRRPVCCGRTRAAAPASSTSQQPQAAPLGAPPTFAGNGRANREVGSRASYDRSRMAGANHGRSVLVGCLRPHGTEGR